MSAALAQRHHSTNLVGIPTGLLASVAFNEHPVPLRLGGVREMNAGLFRLLDESPTLEEAGLMFQTFVAELFALEKRARPGDMPAAARDRRFRSSYVRLLQGWGFDSNGPQGAVLKGWVESRFGLLPTFHKHPLGRFASDAWMTYVVEKMSSRFHNNAINAQLDLLYEFSQWAIARFAVPARGHVTLYRGVNDFDEQRIVDARDRRSPVVRMNSLASFSFFRETAEQFGDWIIEAEVPVVKLLFFNGLLPAVPLRGEGECLVIGGDYRVRASYW